jgi:hypothetical protein
LRPAAANSRNIGFAAAVVAAAVVFALELAVLVVVVPVNEFERGRITLLVVGEGEDEAGRPPRAKDSLRSSPRRASATAFVAADVDVDLDIVGVVVLGRARWGSGASDIGNATAPAPPTKGNCRSGFLGGKGGAAMAIDIKSWR